MLPGAMCSTSPSQASGVAVSMLVLPAFSVDTSISAAVGASLRPARVMTSEWVVPSALATW